MMKTYMTRILTVLMLMMFSMGASADVKIFFGEKGEELKTGETKIQGDNGTIAIEQKASDDGSSTTIYLTFTPNNGYTISSDNIEVYAVISTGSGSTRTPEISGDPLKLNEESSKDPEKRYSVKIDSKLGLWIKVAKFGSGSKGNRDVTNPTYYALHQNGKGYLRVNGEGSVSLSNDGTFRYGNIFDNNGSSLWVYTSDGYLKNNYFYLNVANNSTLYLSVDPVTQWTLEDIDGQTKKHVKINDGANDLYLCNDNNTIKLATSPSSYYNACPITLTEQSWSGPTTSDLTLQSPQLITYLRGYFTQKFNYSFVNDAGATVSENNKERRVYATYSYTSGGDSNKGTDWDISSDGIIYNLKASGDVAVTATYDVLPSDPIALALHPAASSMSNRKFTIKQKALSPTANMDYLIFSIKGGDDYRYPYDDGIAQDNPVKANGKGGTTNASVLTDPLNDGLGRNQQISWNITTDDAGFCMFQNTSTGRYLYFYEPKSTSGSFGELRVGATTLPTDATLSQYKFRLYKTSTTDYSTCYFIIPYSKLFAIYKSDGIASDLYASLNITDYKTDNTIRLFKSNDNSKWCIYKYEAEYRVRTDFTFSGPASTDATGNVTFTSSDGWYGKYIKESPKDGGGQRGLVVSGSYNTNKVNYIWTVIGLDDYIDHTDWTTGDGGYVKTIENNKTFTFNVTSLPVSTASGTIQLQLRGGEEDKNSTTNPYKWSGKKTLGFTILGNGTVEFTEISSLSEITSSGGAYRLTGNASGTPGVSSFSGILDGNGYTISGLTAPLFTTLNNGTVRNLNVSGVSIAGHAGPTGAIAGTANGGSRIYNVGILDGSVGSSGVCGGLVGVLDGSARVVNCFSYANITSGTTVGGIVGENKFATTTADMRTMVMNCMFYGDFDINNTIDRAPIYNGKIITNRGDNNGVSNFNYFWAGADYVQKQKINTYNCALSAETRYLQRFEFFRNLLNSNREVAAWWATGSRNNKNEMMKWVMEPDQIGTSTPYPILKAPGRYKSVVYIDDLQINEVTHTGTSNSTNPRLSTLNVTIEMGNGAVYEHPTNASIVNSSLTLDILDKDPDHFNFNYKKVQLPYYNDVGTKNYTGNRVVTGWKIVRISDGSHHFSKANADATAEVSDEGDITLTTPYNFADRHCTDKDLYSVSGRIFNQGAYWDVPEGVTAITIQPYWAKAAYLADAYADVTYNQNMNTSYNVPNVGGGQIYTNGDSYDINGENQVVYTSISSAIGSSALNPNTSHTVYDYAVVLVGNYHQYYTEKAAIGGSFPYTVTSIDRDGDNEPDYSYILRFDNRCVTHPVRVDFLNIPGLGMAQKSSGGTGTYNFGIMQPKGWFEATNTALFRVTQLEYDLKGRSMAPMILQGGVIEQWVTYAQGSGEANAVEYYHVGGNVWFKEFHIGAHQDRQDVVSPHPPISVTGGDYEEFYLTGLYNTPTNNYDDNAECYINGGHFGKVAGTGYQGLGASGGNSKGDIIWQIDNADIDEFYAGGINAAHKAEGNIYTVISNSRVDQFCGGPKFGDMNSDKKVVTNATDCTFRTFFGAGFGGNSYNRRYPTNQTNKVNIDWNSWVQGNDGLKYRYDSGKGGVETRIDYQFLPMSDNTSNVCRLFVDYVSFSLATTHDVTSKLTDCTITKSPLGSLDLFEGCIGNFYGGGSLGKVDGPVKSTLINCTVEGNAFGAGYSASTPKVGVMDNSFQKQPHYDENLGAYLEAKLPATTPYTWEHRNVVNSKETAINTTNHILYTSEDLTALGKVTGTATLNIEGTTTVAGNVYGGGEESDVAGNTQVTISNGTIGNGSSIDVEHGNVFGGGKGSSENYECDKAMVGVNNAGAGVDPGTDENKDKGTKVTISNGTVYGNVYGGGEVGRVEWNTQVTIGTAGDTQNTPTVNGNVFGAGAGVETHGYSALVRGNSTVLVQGKAKVLQNVYGGGEKATVGRYWVKGINNMDGDNVIEEAKPVPDDLPVGMPYKQQSGGKCKVIIQDNAQIGPDDGGTKTAGHVFGAGKGVVPGTYNYTSFSGASRKSYPYRMALYDSEKYSDDQKNVTWEYFDPDNKDTNLNIWEYFNTEEKYLTFLQTLALVTNSNVTIDGSSIVKGSVYGGSESGYVQHDTKVTVSGGTIGTTDLGGAYFGNVYGGGKGDAENTGTNNNYLAAGIVKGCTKVKIEGGTILHNIYGGGAYGSVGVFDYNATTGLPTGLKTTAPTNSGKTEIYITGGTIGTTGKENGMIFGSSRGNVGAPNSIHDKLAWVYDTHVAIGDTTENATITTAAPLIRGSIYGGGENGHNLNNSYVRINGGTIGISEGEPVTSGGVEYSGAAYPYRGNVYGGGCGTDKYYASGVAGQGHTLNDGLGDTFNPKAGIVQGNAFVNMTAGYVVHNVYGAGAMGSVGKLNTDGTVTGGTTTINISGGTIGVDGTKGDGNVFGAARGDVDAISNEAALVRKATDVSISGSALIKGNVYGGGELGCVGTYSISDDMRTFTWQDTDGTNNTAANSDNKNTGICNVIIDGSSAVINGHVFGAGKGKDDTFWCEKGIAYRTIVNVKNGTVNGNVYGGGEVGRVETDTKVKIGDGDGTEGGEIAPTITGSVFGGGAGVETHGYSALVRGNTTVNVEGNAAVGHSVYGGGEIASVGKYGLDAQNMPSILQGGGYCYVTVQGYATIAEDVFGAGKGVTPHFDKDNQDETKRSRRMTLKSGWKDRVGADRFDWNYLTDEAAYSTYLETLALATHPEVTIDGSAEVSGSVFGGGELGLTKGSVVVTIQGGTITEDVYGGGKLANTNTTNSVDTNGDGVADTTVDPTTTLNLYGGLINGDAYGGGLGQKTGFYDANGAIATSDIEATVYGDITVNLGSIETPATEENAAVLGPATKFNIRYEETGDKDEANNPIKVVQSGRVFGCNNLNGSPQGDVAVNVYRTVAGTLEGLPNTRTAAESYKKKEGDAGYVAPTYELAAVYGGGNLADYTATDKKASVIIHTCDVSVQHVYGGGNAAVVPETDVLVKGAYEIEHVFGGGNGKDKYKKGNEWIINAGANVSTNTNTLLIGGYIHEAYGGSNEKGTIGGNVTINTDSKDERCVCDLELVKLYGAGKNADIDGDLIVVLDCAPETKTEEIYGGAENANVRGNVELTITSGSFGKVFGGNNQSGAIFGHIILNIEETSCRPIIIDELYGCGNNAAYSVYGYKEGTDADGYKIYVPRTSLDDGVAVTFNKDENQTAHTTPQYADPQVNIISCTSIGKVFGGGYGSGATVYGNPTVNINQIYGKAYDGNAYTATATTLGEIGEVFGGGNEANVVGNTTVNVGTVDKVNLHLSVDKSGNYTMSEDSKDVVGANITGNVYGGGNQAEVTGNTNVNIGRQATGTPTP